MLHALAMRWNKLVIQSKLIAVSVALGIFANVGAGWCSAQIVEDGAISHRLFAVNGLILLFRIAGSIAAITIIFRPWTNLLEELGTIERRSSHHGGLIESDDEFGRLGRSLNRMSEDLEQLAYYDPLTSLPNRTRFINVLHQAILQVEGHRQGFALVFLDLDNFKRINDSLGHSAGDELLRGVVERLSQALDGRYYLARIGADEFVAILHGAEAVEQIDPVVHLISSMFAESIKVGAQRLIQVKCSMGIAICPDDGQDVETLFKNADTAMNRAKELGKNNIQYYTPGMNELIRKKTNIEQALQAAVVTGGLSLQYQPQLDLSTGRVRGLEALLRWEHPELGHVSPAEFIPIAEETGLILSMGEWIMQEACRKLKELRPRFFSKMTMSVNVSALELKQPAFVERTLRILDEHGLSANDLELEMTESLLIESYGQTIGALMELHRHGVKIALDDFGTGYSSLSYLQRLPIDTLKIDKAFIQGITEQRPEREITEAIIALVHKLGLEVVAEGIESEAQLERLREWQCDSIQGYLFSRPLDEDQLTEFLEMHV